MNLLHPRDRGLGGRPAGRGSMAPDQWSIGRSNQYSSCWRPELRLHRWKWVGRSGVWWWFMLAGQMFHFGERLFDRRGWMSLPGQRASEWVSEWVAPAWRPVGWSDRKSCWDIRWGKTSRKEEEKSRSGASRFVTDGEVNRLHFCCVFFFFKGPLRKI